MRFRRKRSEESASSAAPTEKGRGRRAAYNCGEVRGRPLIQDERGRGGEQHGPCRRTRGKKGECTLFTLPREERGRRAFSSKLRGEGIESHQGGVCIHIVPWKKRKRGEKISFSGGEKKLPVITQERKEAVVPVRPDHQKRHVLGVGKGRSIRGKRERARETLLLPSVERLRRWGRGVAPTHRREDGAGFALLGGGQEGEARSSFAPEGDGPKGRDSPRQEEEVRPKKKGEGKESGLPGRGGRLHLFSVLTA